MSKNSRAVALYLPVRVAVSSAPHPVGGGGL